MKDLKDIIIERLHINKNTGKDINYNSIQELSDKYDFDLLSSECRTWYEGKKYNNKKFKISNDLFKTNINNKIMELHGHDITLYANKLNDHFKYILNDKYLIALTNINDYTGRRCIVRIDDMNDNNCAESLYDDDEETITFKILKDEKEAEEILVNVIDYIVNN